MCARIKTTQMKIEIKGRYIRVATRKDKKIKDLLLKKYIKEKSQCYS